MKKKWYKRIFAGILALALTATSFSGDIENLVKAASFTDNTIPIEAGIPISGFFYATEEYTKVTGLKIKLYNQSDDSGSITWSVTAYQNGDSGIGFSSSNNTTVLTPGEAKEISINVPQDSGISLTPGENLTMQFTASSTSDDGFGYPTIYCYDTGEGQPFVVETSTDTSDSGKYSVSPFSPSTLNMFVGDSIQINPQINMSGYENRNSFTYESSASGFADVDVSGNISAVTAGNATITVEAPNGSSTTLTVNVQELVANTTGPFEYDGTDKTPIYTLNPGGGSASIQWQDGRTEHKDAGVYVGTYTSPSGSSKEVSFEITKKDITGASVTTNNIAINNSTGAITGNVVTSVGTLVIDQDVSAEESGTPTTVLNPDGKPTGLYTKYNLKLTGINNYTGVINSVDTYVKADKNDPGSLVDISSKTTVVVTENEPDKYVYNGKNILPGVDSLVADLAVTYNGALLTKGSYNPTTNTMPLTNSTEIVAYASFRDCKNAGEAYVVVEGNPDAGYTGTVVAEYPIYQLNVKSCEVVVSPDTYWYEAGVTPTPDVTLRDKNGNTILPVDADGTINYTVSYEDNDVIGTAEAKVTGKNNLTGKKSGYFDINGTISGATVLINNLASYETTYTGKAIEPSVTVFFGSNPSQNLLRKGSNYTVKYENNVNAGTATITITGAGQYATPIDKNQQQVTFKINPAPLPQNLKIVEKERVFKNDAWTLNLEDYDLYTNGGVKLQKGVDYGNATYENNTNAGTGAKITVSGMGNYTGTASANFEIKPLDLSTVVGTENLKLTVENQRYTGDPLKPAVSVQLYGKDFPLSNFVNPPTYTNNINVGEATVKLTGTGENVKGSASTKFQILGKTFADCTVTMGGLPVKFPFNGNDNYGYCEYKAEYTGVNRAGTVTVMDGSKTVPRQLILSDAVKVYSSPYTNYVTVKAYPNGNYTGSEIRIYFTITPRDIKKKDITFTQGDAIKEGGRWVPNFTEVKDKPAGTSNYYNLEKGTDYYINVPTTATKPGTYTAEIHGIGNYGNGTDNKPRLVEYTVGQDVNDLTIKLYPGATSATAYTDTDSDDVIDTDYLGQLPAYKVFKPGNVELTQAEYAQFDAEWSNTTSFNADDSIRTLTLTPKATSTQFFNAKSVNYKINPVDLGKLRDQKVLQLVDSAKSTYDSSTFILSIPYDGEKHYPRNFTLNRLAVQGGAVLGALAPTDVEYDVAVVGPAVTAALIPLKVKGIGSNYTGTATFSVQIVPKSVEDPTIKISSNYDSGVTYTGSQLKPEVTVKDGSKVLTEGTDYEVTYGDNKEAGTGAGSYTVTGIGNYTGSKLTNFNINKMNSRDFTVTFNTSAVMYDGTEKTPGYTVYYQKKKLTKGVDYTESWGDNINPSVDGAKLIVTPAGQYEGDPHEFNFSIIADIGDRGAAGETDDYVKVATTYTTDITLLPTDGAPEILRKMVSNPDAFLAFIDKTVDPVDEVPLEYGTDYEVDIDKLAPGVRHLIVKGKGCYTGTRSFEVTLKADLANVTINDSKPIEYYTGSDISDSHTPQIEVKWGDTVLSQGTDYVVEYQASDKKNGGNKPYIIKPAAMATYLTGSKTGSFDVFYNLNEMTVKLSLDKKKDPQTGGNYYHATYTGSAIESSPQLMLNGNSVSGIIQSQNYMVTYNPTAHTNPGRVNVIILPYVGGSGTNYTVGSASTYFVIEGISLDTLTIESGDNEEYDGEPHVPTVKVTGGGSDLDEKNYDLVFFDAAENEISKSQCVDAGTYYVAARGKGGYAGETAKKSFVIKPCNIGDHYSDGPTFTKGQISAVVSDPSVVYDGEAKTPTVAVDYHTSASGTRALVKDTDFTIEYKNNVNACTIPASYDSTKASYEITGKGNYTGTFKKNFTIEQATISNITIENNESAYNGREITPTIIVKGVKDEVLTKDTDYTVISSPAIIKEKGIYNITIKSTGNGNYKAGNTTVDKNGNPLIYTVKARNFDDIYIDAKINGKASNYTSDNVYLSDWNVVSYDPATTPITVEVTDTFKDVDSTGASSKPIAGTDYKINGPFNVSGSGDGSLGDITKSPYIEIEALPTSEYEGTKQIFFSIGNPLSACYIKQIQPEYKAIYSNSQKKPGDSQIVVIDPATGKPVPRTGTNGGYIINWPDDMINAGTKYITVTGTGKYFGTISTDNAGKPITYTIEQKEVSLDTIEVTLPGTEMDAEGNYVTYWTGNAIEPTVRVYDKQLHRDLILDKDYTIEYVNNFDVTDGGVPAIVKITPVAGGNYSDKNGGTLYADYLIKPIKMNDHNIEVRWTDEGADNNVVYWNNNTEVVPNYEVYYIDENGATHVLDTGTGDYTVSYRYLKKDGTYAYSDVDGVRDSGFKFYAGQMDLVVTGGGNYSGTVAKPYYIRANLSDMNSNPEQYIADTSTVKPFYTGEIPVISDLIIDFASEGHLNLPTAADKIDSAPNTVVWRNSDFTITYDNDYGDANRSGHMVITSNNSKVYTGEFEYRFETEDSVDAIILDEHTSTYHYTGAPVSLVYTLKTTGGSPVSNSVSTVTYYKSADTLHEDPVSPIAVGQYDAVIHIDLAGNVKDITVPFTIIQGDLTGANIICTDPQTYTGGVIKPEVLVYLGKYRLTEGIDYTVAYTDETYDNKTPVAYSAGHTGADTGLITITGIGNYSGTASKSFEINPASPKHLVVDNQQSTALRVGWVRNEHVGEWIVECRANSASVEPVATKHVGPLDNFAEITGLMPGTQYYITVYSKAEGVTGEAMTISDSSARTTVADITGVVPTVTGNRVSLVWNPVPNAGGYEIIRSNDINQNYRLVASFPSTFGGWTNNNLKPGTYYFKIRAYSVDANKVVTYGGYSDPVMVVIP